MTIDEPPSYLFSYHSDIDDTIVIYCYINVQGFGAVNIFEPPIASARVTASCLAPRNQTIISRVLMNDLKITIYNNYDQIHVLHHYSTDVWHQ